MDAASGSGSRRPPSSSTPPPPPPTSAPPTVPPPPVARVQEVSANQLSEQLQLLINVVTPLKRDQETTQNLLLSLQERIDVMENKDVLPAPKRFNLAPVRVAAHVPAQPSTRFKVPSRTEALQMKKIPRKLLLHEEDSVDEDDSWNSDDPHDEELDEAVMDVEDQQHSAQDVSENLLEIQRSLKTSTKNWQPEDAHKDLWQSALQLDPVENHPGL